MCAHHSHSKARAPALIRTRAINCAVVASYGQQCNGNVKITTKECQKPDEPKLEIFKHNFNSEIIKENSEN